MFTTVNLTRRYRVGSAGRALVALLVAGAVQPDFAANPTTLVFDSPEQAAVALYTAVKDDDQENLERLIGPLSSSDEVAKDKADREQFVRKYSEMHRLLRQPDGTTVLYIGAENWPFPVPLLAANGKWRFDVDAGTREMMFRRIGEDETAAVQTCVNIAHGTKAPAESLQGYQFRVLNASRGTVFVAYPSEYGVTGIMTFAVTPGGAVYEKDLGPNTPQIAQGMTRYKPDRTWNVAKQ
jgi:hypothetical protein